MTGSTTIDRSRVAIVLYDIINAGIKPRDEAVARAIRESGLVVNLSRVVAAARERSVPIMWIVPRRRPDRLGLPDNVTAAGRGWAGLDEREQSGGHALQGAAGGLHHAQERR